ncbi:uncharacterized protein LOC131246182 isoform X2 [Magnolia sinica]|uniref:uncharacterized protein LOC131246182 isoform X2 n=1 Tax=Magnolia sinica TaxID=86752 RepID=UPI0026588D52|nr:uncharacterized protein LOC131246182 isoform X2 [Magnolia sinica]
MQRGRGGRGNFFDFGDPFASFGSFGDHKSIMSSFFGKDPFDDPFFSRPFGSMFGPSMLGPSIFGEGGSLFMDSPNSGFLEHQALPPSKSTRPIIQELSSDDEGEDRRGKDGKGNSRSSDEPFVQHPDEETEACDVKCYLQMALKKLRLELHLAERSKHMQCRNEYNRAQRTRPQSQTFSFQSSSVTYGGANGAYYTSSKTRRTGSDGMTLEESKEADTTTGRASHRISRGIHDKGHSVTRKLKSDGKVDTVQTLHNLNGDELAGFEEAWKVNAKKHLPGWNHEFDMLNSGHEGNSGGRRDGRASQGWALPSTESPPNRERIRSQGNARANSSSRRA